jgi:sugar phosphate isomerase/epimerase
MVLIPAFSAQDQPTMDALVASIRDLVPTAADLGIGIGVESNLPAAEVLSMLERMGSPSVVGDYYDMGNAAGRGMDPAEEVRLRGSRVVRVHVKGTRGAALDAGTVDLAAVRDALRATAYDGWMLLETSAGDDAIANARHNVALMRDGFPV